MAEASGRDASGRDSAARKRLGDAGERLAATWLEARGYRILTRQWRCPYGELDLVAMQGDEIVFVEVKTRRGGAMGAPEEAVTPTKRAKLITAAQMYLADQGLEQNPYRIDVLAVDLAPTGRFLGVRQFTGAIGAEE